MAKRSKVATIELPSFLAGLSESACAKAQQLDTEWESLGRKSAELIHQMGCILNEMAALLEGNYLQWLEYKGIDDATASRWRAVASKFPDAAEVSGFGASVLYLLASPSTPIAAKEEAINLSKQQEQPITVAQVKHIIDRSTQSEFDRLRKLYEAQDFILEECLSNHQPYVARSNDNRVSRKFRNLREVESGLPLLIQKWEQKQQYPDLRGKAAEFAPSICRQGVERKVPIANIPQDVESSGVAEVAPVKVKFKVGDRLVCRVMPGAADDWEVKNISGEHMLLYSPSLGNHWNCSDFSVLKHYSEETAFPSFTTGDTVVWQGREDLPVFTVLENTDKDGLTLLKSETIASCSLHCSRLRRVENNEGTEVKPLKFSYFIEDFSAIVPEILDRAEDAMVRLHVTKKEGGYEVKFC